MISTQEAADRLGISGQRVRQLLEAGKIDGQRIGAVWVVDEDSVKDRIAALAVQRGELERREHERREAERRHK